jgi:hypothetical protein
MPFIDPRTAARGPLSITWTPTGPIPVAVRKFGYFPNISDWLPADLILVSPVQPDWIHRQITQAQIRGGYHPAHATWQHAAVYLGDGYLCEAGTSGVRYAPVSDYVGQHLIQVRRDFTLTPDERWRLAIQAVVRLGESYDFRDIWSLYRRSLRTSWTVALRAQFQSSKRSVICSRLYSDAFSAVTGRILVSSAPSSITPAALSAATVLTDVATHWNGIA